LKVCSAQFLLDIFCKKTASKCKNNDKQLLTLSRNAEDGQSTKSTNTTKKLEDLRGLMASLNLSAYIVPIDDQGRLGWISGFTGSNGKAIITINKVNKETFKVLSELK
jgi:hypothetical protein